MSEDLDKKFQSGEALWESLGGFRILSWDATKRTLRASFTVRREYCHTNGTIAQGGFITAWMDAAMAHAVMYDTDNQFSVASLEIKVSFLERVGPGEGIAEGRVFRRGKRVAFLEAELFDAQGRVQRFLRKHPDLYERVPMKELASHLNLSAETLSRLKQKGKVQAILAR